MKVSPLREIGKKIYQKIPTSLRWVFWPIRLAFRLMDISKLDLWILNGEEITSHQELSIAYAGTKVNRNYLIKLAYDNSFNEKYLGRVWLWKIFNVVREKSPNCSLMVIGVDKLLWRWFRKRTYFNVPFEVSSSADISIDTSLLWRSKDVKNAIRKVRNNKLSFEITRDFSHFDDFYYRMYRPYAIAAYGGRAIICPYDDIKKEFENGELLLIKKENQYIAGALFVCKRMQARALLVGVKDGNFDYVKQGAVASIHYFRTLYLKEKGCKKIDLGLSRPFLKDGVLHYKKKWGGRQIFCPPRVDGAYYVEPLTKTPGLKAFLINNPFIFIDKGEINGAIFVNSDDSVSRELLERIYNHYYFDGMFKLFIYQFRGNSHRTQRMLPLEFSNRIKLCSAESLFQKHH